MMREALWAFHLSIENEQVNSYLQLLSDEDKNTLLRVLLEIQTPVEAVDLRLQKIQNKRNVIPHEIDGFEDYFQRAQNQLDVLAVNWFKINNMI